MKSLLGMLGEFEVQDLASGQRSAARAGMVQLEGQIKSYSFSGGSVASHLPTRQLRCQTNRSHLTLRPRAQLRREGVLRVSCREAGRTGMDRYSV